MVHALDEIWRVLRPVEGCIVDLRPISVQWPVEIVTGGPVLPVGTVEDTLSLEDVYAADNALAQTMVAGWFAVEQIEHFDYRWYWDTPDEMIAYLDERWYARLRVPETTLTQARALLAEVGPEAQIRLSRRMVIARYRKLARATP